MSCFLLTRQYFCLGFRRSHSYKGPMDGPAQPTTPAQRHATSHCWHSPLVWFFFISLVAYPLSTGPVFRLILAGYLPEETVVIYEPLGPLTKARFTKACLEWYIYGLWKVERYR